MANEFIIRKGYKSLYSSEITGSLDVSVSVHATDVFVSGHGSVSASLSSIVANDLDGSGTANYISKFSDTDTLTDSSISDDGSTINLFANTTGNTGVVNIYGEGGVPPTLQVSSRTNRAKLKIADNDTAINIIAEGSIGSFGFGSTSSATNNISILSTGRVGIGVIASTNAMLDVRGPDTDNAVLGRFWSNTGARGSFIIRNGSGVNPTTFIGTAGGSEQLSIGTNNTEAIRIDASQKVGIGITNPLHPLHVVGIISGSDTYINGWNSVSGSLYNITTTHTDFSASVSTRFEGLTTDYTELDNIPNDIVSSSIQVDHDQTTNFVAGEHFLQSAITTVGTVTAGNVNAILPANTVSSSAQIASDISGSITSFSGSIAGRVETNETNITALNGATGSYLLNTTDTLTGNLTVTGTLTAQEFHTEFVSASILFDSGSTKFGDSSDDNHDFTGSLNVLGSITGTVNGYLPLSAGSTNPLTGDLYIEEDSLYLLNASNNYWRVQTNSSGKLTFKQGTTQRGVWSSGELQLANNLIVDSNVGIGTTSPGAKLTIQGADSINAFKITDSGNGDGFKVTSHTTQGTYVQAYNASHTQTIMLDARSDSTARHTYFNGGGNVGIGTTTPEQKLHVGAGHILVNRGIELRSKDTSGSERTITRVNSSNELEYGWSGAGPVKFMGGGAYTERMRIHTNGNVGIGATDPLRKLHVVGNFAVNAATDEYYGVNITGGEGANPNILIGDWHNSSANISWDSTGNYLRIDAQHSTSGAPIVFSGNDSAIEYMRIISTGNVGIGTAAPKQLFHVSGGSTAGDVTKAVIGATGGNAESSLYLAENFSGDNVNWGFSFVADGNSSNNLLIKRHSNNTSGVTVLTINRDNSDASFSGALQVGSNLDVNGTSLTLSSAAITYQNNNDVDTGIETIATVVKANHDAAFFDYVVKNGTNLRAGTVMAVHDGTNVEFTDNSTKDIGDTSGVTFSVDISGTDLRLRATTTSDNWIIKTLVKSI